jgi:hypothetical protein
MTTLIQKQLINEDCGVLGCNAVQFEKCPMFRKNKSPPSLEPKSKQTKYLLEANGKKSSETSGSLRTTWDYDPQDHILHIHRCENLKSNTVN